MAKTFNPNRVLPGTIELVRAADGTYTTKVVGLESINSLSLPEISDTAAVTKTDDGLQVFKKAIDNVSPMLEVKSKRIGGATYQVPVEVPQNRKVALAMRWIIGYAKARKGNNMSDRLSAELMAAYNNEGSSVKKKEDTHKMAEANKAFAHFR